MTRLLRFLLFNIVLWKIECFDSIPCFSGNLFLDSSWFCLKFRYSNYQQPITKLETMMIRFAYTKFAKYGNSSNCYAILRCNSRANMEISEMICNVG